MLWHGGFLEERGCGAQLRRVLGSARAWLFGQEHRLCPPAQGPCRGNRLEIVAGEGLASHGPACPWGWASLPAVPVPVCGPIALGPAGAGGASSPRGRGWAHVVQLLHQRPGRRNGVHPQQGC